MQVFLQMFSAVLSTIPVIPIVCYECEYPQFIITRYFQSMNQLREI